jgi:PleD family two-component response regulator
LQLLADLRAKAQTRDTGVLVLIEGTAAEALAVDALDRGASDVVLEGFAGREIALRLARQIARKHRLDQLRADMRDGLRAALTDPLTGLFNRRYAIWTTSRGSTTASAMPPAMRCWCSWPSFCAAPWANRIWCRGSAARNS